jgi:hypothetical protein
MFYAEQQWTEARPLFLLGIRTAFKEDIEASVAELGYGEFVSIPGELLTPFADPVDSAHLITELRQHMAHLKKVHSTSRLPFYIRSQLPREIYPCLPPSRDNVPGFGAPSSEPYQVLSCSEKALYLLMRGRPFTVSTEMVKLAYILNGTDPGNSIFNLPDDATPTIPSPATLPQSYARTARSGRRIHFPARINI